MIISTFKSVTQAWVENQFDLSWEEAVKLFSDPWPANSKTEVGMFNLGEFKSADDPTVEVGQKRIYKNGEPTDEYNYYPGTTRRSKANLISISGIILDVDRQQSIIDTINILEHYEFLLYSTFNNLIPNPETGRVEEKFRVILPFTQPLLARDIEGRVASIKEQFPGVDHSSFTMSQSFYFHSGEERIVYRNSGTMIDPYTLFEYREPEVYVPKVTPSETMSSDQFLQYQQSVVQSLKTCSNLGYRGTGSGGVLMLVSICKSIGLSYAEYDDICHSIAGADSDLQQAEIRLRAWSGWNGDRISASKRDKFIKDYNGEPIRTVYAPSDNDQIIENLKRLQKELERRKTK